MARPGHTTPSPPRAAPPRGRPPAPVPALLRELARAWPDAVCELDHQDAYQLLVATILAAQSTDRRINQLTPALFARYPDARALAGADAAELEVLIHASGFFRAKARNLLAMARAVVADHGGEIPRTMEGLVALAGVARKTANVVLGTAFGLGDGVVVDTHVARLSARLGLTTETDPVKIERDLQALIPASERVMFAHRLIWHGRRVCHARAPACDACSLAPICPSAGVPVSAASPKTARTPTSKPARRPAARPKAKPAPKARR